MANKEYFEIKVAAGTPCNSLANSIVAAWNDGKEIMLSAIGPQPVNQAFKAVCVANRTLASRGVLLVIMPALINRDIPDRVTQQKVDWVVAVFRLRNLLDTITMREADEVLAEVIEEGGGE